MNSQYFFFLGHTPALSKLELNSLLPSPVALSTESIANFSGELDPASFGPKLGGTRKIAKLLEICRPSDTVSQLTALIAAGLTKNVAITDFGGLNLTHSDLTQIKKQAAQSRPIRLVSLDTTEHELVMLAHQHVTEYNLLPSPEGIIIAETAWIYDAEDWIVRDRAKPYRDIKRGMLPPKLARILVNLATQGKTGLTVYDPFCGTGTILAEALLSGCSVLGSDNNPAAISGSQDNLAWLSQTYSITPSPNYSVALADVTHPPFPSADLIVTEPYMGPLVEGRNVPPVAKLKDLARGLDKLYRGAFRAWHPLLPARGRVVITIPSFHSGKFDIPTISVDTLGSLGYNYISSVAYGKPDATVIRNITILEKK